MKMIKKTILFFLLVSSFLKAETLEMNLVTFATYASNINNINILIDDELKKENIVFIVNDKDKYALSAFRKALQLRGLQLVRTEQFYYIQKKQIYKETHKYRSIKLNFVRFDDIKNFLAVYDKDIKFEFIKTSKILLVKSNEKDFKSIYEMIKVIDTLPTQLKLKVTIIDTNLNKLKELGADSTKLILSENKNLFFNLVSYPFSVKNILDTKESKGFYSFIKALHKNGNTRLVSNPILTLSDEKKTVFDVVDNLPFKVGTVQVDEKDTKTTSAFEYKDVGLQITVTPHIYQENNVYLDLELNVSNVLNNADNLPTTSKKFISQSFHLPVGKAMVLTGINKNEIKTTHSKVPLLNKIPYIGWLFKYETKDENESNLTVMFEVIEERKGV